MNRLLRVAAATLIVSGFLAGCYLEIGDGSGTVGIEIPEVRSMIGAPSADTGRVYVLNGPNLVPLDGNSFVEFALSAGGAPVTEITVGPVASGPGYQILLAFGSREDGIAGSTVFVPTDYALSGEFTVAVGIAARVSLTPVPTPFAPVGPAETLGRDLVGIVYTDAGLFTATSAQLLKGSGTIPSVTFANAGTLPAGRTINSLGVGSAWGATLPWVNTTNGVLPYDGASYDAGFDPLTTSVLSSAAAAVGSNVYGYMLFDGGLRGVYVPEGQSGPQWLAPIDLSEFVVGSPVSDFAIADSGGSFYGYFATKLGTFRLSDGLLTDSAVGSVTDFFEEAEYLTVTIDGRNAQITRLALNRLNPTHLYLGTPRGALRVSESAIGGGEAVVATLIAGTQGRAVRRIVVEGDNVAILTDHFVSVSSNGGTSFTTIPVMASSVGEVSGMFLTPAGMLLISGSHGLVGAAIGAIVQ